MKEIILLGTDFMFTEELGSRLRSKGHIVHPFDSPEDFESRVNNKDYVTKLVIVDVARTQTGGLETIRKSVEKGIKVIALGPHKDGKSLDDAKAAGASLVIANSQASRSIETYVSDLLSS